MEKRLLPANEGGKRATWTGGESIMTILIIVVAFIVAGSAASANINVKLNYPSCKLLVVYILRSCCALSNVENVGSLVELYP
jgi:hypothetical protein